MREISAHFISIIAVACLDWGVGNDAEALGLVDSPLEGLKQHDATLAFNLT